MFCELKLSLASFLNFKLKLVLVNDKLRDLMRHPPLEHLVAAETDLVEIDAATVQLTTLLAQMALKTQNDR